MVLLLVSFVAGILTVLAPCILPLLPVIIGGSVGEGKNFRRALTVTVSLAVSVIIFTLIIKASTFLINIPQSFWTWFSGGIIIIFGLISIFPGLWENLPFLSRLNIGSNKILTAGYQKHNFWGDVIIGAALGPVFSTCSPTYFLVLAAVLPENFALGLVYLTAYSVGLSLSLLLISYVGQKVLNKVGIAANPHGRFKKILGIIFLIVGIGIITGADKDLQTKILDSGFFDVTKVEEKLLQKVDTGEPELAPESQAPAEEAPASSAKTDTTKYLTFAQKSTKFAKAPELVAPNGYINTNGKEIKLADYAGKKVVLVDFWTYSCINCKRTTPYLKAWFKEYEDDGLVIVGVHTPEFAFEKLQKNVEQAVADEGIEYPVVLDNNYQTWNAYGNRYWPRKYLVDIDGFIVYDHIGEGAYDETEKEIQKALMERSARLGVSGDMPKDMASPTNVIDINFGKVKSFETYFGSARNEYLANGTPGVSGSQDFVLPNEILPNKLYLSGKWNITEEYAEGSVGSGIVYGYEAKNVYMVASSDGGATIEILKDGVSQGTKEIKDEKLYDIISSIDYSGHKLEIKINSGKLKVFAFTFG